MPASREAHEQRQQAVWPWILMPLVVLLVAFALDRVKDAAVDAAAQAQTPSAATATASGTTDP